MSLSLLKLGTRRPVSIAACRAIGPICWQELEAYFSTILGFWPGLSRAIELPPACCSAAVPKGPSGHTSLSLEYGAKVLRRGLRCPWCRPKDLAACAMSFPFDLLGTIRHRKSRVIY